MTQAEREYYESKTMATYTGRRVDPLSLKPEDIDIRDIAHALSNICRFNGHCKRFYSVAEHSWIVSRIAFQEAAREDLDKSGAALCGLLHDAGEAYVGDVIRPLRCREEYKLINEIQEHVQAQIFHHFGIEDVPLVRRIDRELVLAEGAQLFPTDTSVVNFPPTVKHSEWRVGWMSPEEAEESFLARAISFGLR